jgi:hypothetical protein
MGLRFGASQRFCQRRRVPKRPTQIFYTFSAARQSLVFETAPGVTRRGGGSAAPAVCDKTASVTGTALERLPVARLA